jgi:4-hydroxy-3-methylbut-2-en-1-yl diphosphate reductase
MIVVELIGLEKEKKAGMYLGPCFGVEAAIKTAELELEKGNPTYSINDIAHDPHVNARLAKKGLKRVEDMAKLKRGDVVIPGAYGLEESVMQQIRNTGATIVPTTCPVVTKAHAVSERFVHAGKQLVIYGNPDHPETRAMVDKHGAEVVRSYEEFRLLMIREGFDEEDIAVTTQTTMNTFIWKDFISQLQQDFSEVVYQDTLCNIVRMRQEEVDRVKPKYDLIIVAGGKPSSNANRLREIGGDNAILVEGPDQLDEHRPLVRVASRIGITSATSKPTDIVYAVKKEVERMLL